jgi:hypothetical protein
MAKTKPAPAIAIAAYFLLFHMNFYPLRKSRRTEKISVVSPPAELFGAC